MLKRPLHVLVTRPRPAGEILCRQIEALGGRTTWFPTLTFLPPLDPAEATRTLTTLGDYDGWIFTSPQAVYASQAVALAAWRRLSHPIYIVAVGAGTTAALVTARLPVTAQPSATAWNSEGVLELPVLQHVMGQKIALISGEGGRTFLQEQLLARGADVDKIPVYRRGCPTVAVAPYVDLVKAHAIDVVVCTSGEGLQNLTSLLSSAGPDLQTVVLIVISERMHRLALTLGFSKILLARNASHGAIMETLTHYAASQTH